DPMGVLRAPGTLDRERHEEIGGKGVESRLRRPTNGFAEPQRPLASGLDARAHALVQDRPAKGSLGRLEVESKRMLIARHGSVSPRLRKQIGDHMSIHRRLRLNPESFRNPRRKRVRSHSRSSLLLSPQAVLFRYP